MADPISILAIGGLAYVGKKLSEPKAEKYEVVDENVSVQHSREQPMRISNAMMPGIDSSLNNMPEKKVEIPSFTDIAPQQRSRGNEVLNMRGRMFDTGRMNNLSPVEKQLVGPGIGLTPDVPAAGGFHQIVRVNPENVGAYRLTTLPGRSGPAQDVSGGRRGIAGQIGNNRPEKTAFLPERRPVAGGQSQGFGGHVPRGEHVNSKRLTNRSQTGPREDGLGFNGAKRIVSGMTLSQDPTRNKKDGNIEQYQYYNQPAPNVNKYSHGYLMSPATKIGESRTYGTSHTVKELSKYGFRPDDRRGKANRFGNAGRMNVRAGPLNQGGLPTAMRADSTRVDGRTGPISGGWTQQYTNNSQHQFNIYKGLANPNATTNSLDIAKRQLQNNPIAQQMM